MQSPEICYNGKFYSEIQIFRGVANNDATCTEMGTKNGTCLDCGAPGTFPDKNQPALGHSFTDYASDENATVSTTIAKLTKGKTCYTRVRTVKTVSGKKYYSGWSAVKSAKISK